MHTNFTIFIYFIYLYIYIYVCFGLKRGSNKGISICAAEDSQGSFKHMSDVHEVDTHARTSVALDFLSAVTQLGFDKMKQVKLEWNLNLDRNLAMLADEPPSMTTGLQYSKIMSLLTQTARYRRS